MFLISLDNVHMYTSAINCLSACLPVVVVNWHNILSTLIDFKRKIIRTEILTKHSVLIGLVSIAKKEATVK